MSDGVESDPQIERLERRALEFTGQKWKIRHYETSCYWTREEDNSSLICYLPVEFALGHGSFLPACVPDTNRKNREIWRYAADEDEAFYSGPMVFFLDAAQCKYCRRGYAPTCVKLL
jgi:hypothetical protein